MCTYMIGSHQCSFQMSTYMIGWQEYFVLKPFREVLFICTFSQTQTRTLIARMSSFTPEQENALSLQAQELLHYTKTKMGKDIQARAQKRINDLAAAQLAALEVAININNDKASAHVNAPAVKQNTRVPPAPVPPAQTNKPRKNNSSKPPVDGITWGQLEAIGLPGLEQHPKAPQREPLPPRKRSSPERAHVPWAIPTAPIPNTAGPIPKSVQLEWQRLTAIDPFPNTPICCCDSCPFTTGPLMLRRYNIMLAMMNLEDHLYYNGVMMP